MTHYRQDSPVTNKSTAKIPRPQPPDKNQCLNKNLSPLTPRGIATLPLNDAKPFPAFPGLSHFPATALRDEGDKNAGRRNTARHPAIEAGRRRRHPRIFGISRRRDHPGSR